MKRLLLAAILILSITICFQAPVFALSVIYDWGVVTNNPASEPMPLYSAPSEHSEITGMVYNGVEVSVHGYKGEWVYVFACMHYGYMKKDMLTYGSARLDIPYETPILVVSPSDGSDKAKVREKPNAESPVVIEHVKGTLVQSKGLFNGWAYVRVGARLGFMQIDDLATSGYAPNELERLSGKFEVEFKPGAGSVKFYAAAHMDSPITGEGDADAFQLTPFAGLAIIGDWVQVCYNWSVDFISKEYLVMREAPAN